MVGGNREVAIVGMACVMPGAPDVEAFWANVVDGVDSVTEVPSSRWNPERHFDPDYDSSARRPHPEPMTVSKWGGFVPDVGFDALAWGIPPASLASIDPAQLLALKVAAAALHDAGYEPGDGKDHPSVRPFDRERASVIYATGSGGASDLPAGFLLRLLLRNHGIYADALPPELDAYLPELTEDGLPGVLTSVIAGRVANRLDLGGKNLTVDSACASVLVALDIACNELGGGSSDLVLCGGVDLHNGAQDYVSFTAAQALSRSGRCRAFDMEADGMTLAEGVGCIVLKRLADAARDGDRIYAVVRGVAGSSDGRHLGLTAPRQAGQELAVRRAYTAAGLSPTDVGLVEAHGTGTAAGDRTELRTTTEVFGEAGVAPGSVVLGSVKSNIGHIKCAAGIAALIKTAKSVYHGVLPPTLHIDQPNEEWDPDTSPFVFLDTARPWLEPRRLAGVSSFGFGGTNFHAILEGEDTDMGLYEPHGSGEIPMPHRPSGGIGVASGRPHWPSELFAFRAVSDAELIRRLGALSDRLADSLGPVRQADRWRLRDIAASVDAQGNGPVRLAVVADDLDDLAAKVQAALEGRPSDGVYRAPTPGSDDPSGTAPRPRVVAFLFPSGSSEGGASRLAADLLVAFPGLRAPARADLASTAALLPAPRFGRHHLVAPAAADLAAADDPAGTRAVALAGLTVAHALAALGLVPDRIASEGDDLGQLHTDQRVTVFVDVGPGTSLASTVGPALGAVPHVAVAVDQPGRHGLSALLHAVAQLAVTGVPLDLEVLRAGRDARPERWDEPPAAPGWIVNGHYARRANGDSLPKGLNPASQAPVFHIAGGPPSSTDPTAAALGDGAGAADTLGSLRPGDIAAVVEYLKILQGVTATASDLVRGHVETVGRPSNGSHPAP